MLVPPMKHRLRALEQDDERHSPRPDGDAERRRSAIEAEIGHIKTDGRLTRCTLRGLLAMPSSYAPRLRTQHPQDPGPPQVLAGLDNRCAIGRKQRARTVASDRHNCVNASFRPN
jgi:hypothetical protein